MATELPSNTADPLNGSGGSNTRWEGYSDYKVISLQVAKSVDNAIEAYSRVHGAHAENATIDPDLAAEARGRILSAALKLVVELRQDRDSVETYAEILDRWEGEEGFINRFNEIQLQSSCPGWLFQFVLDIRTAGWELGYLQAGRTTKGEPDDPVEADVQEMFTE